MLKLVKRVERAGRWPLRHAMAAMMAMAATLLLAPSALAVFHECPPGQVYQPPAPRQLGTTAWSCRKCPSGQVPDFTGDFCRLDIKCRPGGVPNEYGTECLACKQGTILDEHHLACVACAPGTFSNADHTKCVGSPASATPGLLEATPGFGPQGPAATGTPRGGGAAAPPR